MHHIRKMYCQKFTFKFIALAYQILQAKPVLSPGLISLHYSEFVGNKHSNVPAVSGPSVAVGPRNNIPAGPPLIGPAWVDDALPVVLLASSCRLGTKQTTKNICNNHLLIPWLNTVVFNKLSDYKRKIEDIRLDTFKLKLQISTSLFYAFTENIFAVVYHVGTARSWDAVQSALKRICLYF